MLILGSQEDCDKNNMFSDDAYNRAKYFDYNDYSSAVDFVYKQIKVMFGEKMNLEKHYKFDCYYGMDTIRKIYEDASDLDYEDYHDIATFYDEDENYFCDLVIIDGDFGLRYSSKDEYGDFENIHFEKCDLNLENNITLMLSMQDKLDNFIKEELLHSIQMDNSHIKI